MSNAIEETWRHAFVSNALVMNESMNMKYHEIS